MTDYFYEESNHRYRQFSQNLSKHVIEDFEIGQLLGRGGFGDVYKAFAKKGEFCGKEIAIKIIDKSSLKSDALQRVYSEAKIHAKLSHSSILKLYYSFEDSRYFYMVMELCHNGELYKYIHQRRVPLSEAEARWVMIQIIEGLLYMHEHGIMHRDLKLSNILLTERNELKIADFGLATNINERNGEPNTLCGTPNYISPEIISRKPYGLATDVWSLGCMLATILTGQAPFESKEVQKTLDRVTKADYELPNTLSREAKNLINQLLQVVTE
ncbi:12766_t:CDS:2 [Ambispora leptoticha]|uniref:12766_t:CDS:1 n=1 Tax=Ambispora leptoticha TaxID=144679 RepID=A0A9N8ZWD3_9GLOM|nr:12766_t:CDS:2 [Ambispora leptoticha]